MILFCAILSACASGGATLSVDAFYDVPVGSTQDEVIAALGKPVAQHKKNDGSVEYEYVERLTIGSRNVSERRFYVLMKDGRVVSKRVKQSEPLPYGFDSYEMQTTQNGDPL